MNAEEVHKAYYARDRVEVWNHTQQKWLPGLLVAWTRARPNTGREQIDKVTVQLEGHIEYTMLIRLTPQT